jgi:abortive infection bacteriophage resistance protein
LSNRIPFAKPALTPAQILAKLQNQGLVVPAPNAALTYLQHVGPYRLKGFWFHIVDDATKQFPQGFTFDEIVRRYEFDRELGAMTFEAVVRFEVAARSTISNYLSVKYGPHWFLRNEIFAPTQRWGLGGLLKKVEDEVRRAHNRLPVANYNQKYNDPYLPPSWAMSECVTFGMWSRTYAILRDQHDRKAIARKFQVDEPGVFQSWLHSMTDLRNVVAHHDRLLRSKLPNGPADYRRGNIRHADAHSFFAFATVLNYLLVATGLPSDWKANLVTLFDKYPDVPLPELGFPTTWQSEPGW